MVDTVFRQAGLGCMRKVVEEARESTAVKSNPPWVLSQSSILNSCVSFFP